MCGVLLLWIFHILYENVRFHKKYRFPNHIPGRVPIFGNLLQMPKNPADQRLHFAELAKKHGEMFTLKLGSNYWVFLNSHRVVGELLEKRGALYVSRQNLPMAGDVISRGKRIVFLPFGDLWKWQRKVIHEILGPAQRGVFGPFQDAESRTLLAGYLDQPDKWHLSHARYSSSVVFSMTFGRRTDLHDPTVKKIVEINDELTKSFEPGSNLIDAFPFLAKIPFAHSLQPWRWWGDSLYKAALENFSSEFDALVERQRQGKVTKCFVSEFLRLGRHKEIDRESMVFLAGSLIEAGSDTTRVSLNQLAAAAALFPDWVERARKELDEVCGSNAERLPTADDAPRLPYIKAAAKETVRWNPSFGEIAHSLIKDDEFEGYRFPAGTTFVWNHWGIHNDPNEYEQPERFYPERFLNADLEKPTKGHLGFGAGRRVCPGWTVASASLFLGISRLIYCFDFHTVPGRPIPTGRPFSIGVDKPYEVGVTVRSQAHADLIRRECRPDDGSVNP
ncbi:cytochrome P450 [Aaosphaeria arxii CBS 175.79]|uniref:Cytochrome P450 n=1 Tax=Aaosphaeria arxii CBS 175.79 TaxID=1450172 RepID=A0A6A5X7B2_9PLEO|nr:cytochrome P450 [Aaosphaeria arxii CBS 175.79]KAF2008786.1 cytochrome P450 [Aaosphaeria arxii CBS 175.79]